MWCDKCGAYIITGISISNDYWVCVDCFNKINNL